GNHAVSGFVIISIITTRGQCFVPNRQFLNQLLSGRIQPGFTDAYNPSIAGPAGSANQHLATDFDQIIGHTTTFKVSSNPITGGALCYCTKVQLAPFRQLPGMAVKSVRYSSISHILQ